MVIFLIAIMIWHEEGTTFNTRKVVLPITNAAACELTAAELRDLWRKDIAHATINIECVPVARLVKA